MPHLSFSLFANEPGAISARSIYRAFMHISGEEERKGRKLDRRRAGESIYSGREKHPASQDEKLIQRQAPISGIIIIISRDFLYFSMAVTTHQSSGQAMIRWENNKKDLKSNWRRKAKERKVIFPSSFSSLCPLQRPKSAFSASEVLAVGGEEKEKKGEWKVSISSVPPANNLSSCLPFGRQCHERPTDAFQNDDNAS